MCFSSFISQIGLEGLFILPIAKSFLIIVRATLVETGGLPQDDLDDIDVKKLVA